MAFDPLSAAFELGKTAIEKIWPDPTKRAQELRLLEELRQKGDLAKLNAHVQLMLGQMEINKIEAGHKSKFVAGWRPMVGWVAAISLALAYIPKALVITYVWTYQAIAMIKATEDMSKFVFPAFPDIGVTDIIGLLAALLGMATLRTVDKTKGTQTDSIK